LSQKTQTANQQFLLKVVDISELSANQQLAHLLNLPGVTDGSWGKNSHFRLTKRANLEAGTRIAVKLHRHLKWSPLTHFHLFKYTGGA
jgi:hypothetical protein